MGWWKSVVYLKSAHNWSSTRKGSSSRYTYFVKSSFWFF